jgi:hypothetical protein
VAWFVVHYVRGDLRIKVILTRQILCIQLRFYDVVEVDFT